jgi:hypothetical protein
LALIIRENAKHHEEILSSWFRERQQQLNMSLEKTIQNGKLCTEGNTWRFWSLKLIFSVMRMIPPLNRILEKGPRAKGMIRYEWQEGLTFLGNACGGICLPQVFCAPVSSLKGLEVSFTDDVIFQKNKRGIFQLLVLLENTTDIESARKAITGLNILSDSLILPHEATFIIQKSEVDVLHSNVDNDVYRLATADEFAASDTLCRGRPAPQYYDMYQMKWDLRRKRFAIVRPDYFLYAACDTTEELKDICASMRKILSC